MKDTTNTKDFPANSIQGDVNCCGNSKRHNCLTKARTLFKNIFEGRSITSFSPSETLRQAAINTIKQIEREDFAIQLFASKQVEDLYEKNYIKLKKEFYINRKYESSAFRAVYSIVNWLNSLSEFKKKIATCILFFLGQLIGIAIFLLLLKMKQHGY